MEAKADSPVLTIVTVEDSAVIVDRLKRMLCDIPGIQCKNAETVAAAMELIDATLPDVVIIDIHLRNDDKNGIDLLSIIRKRYPGMKTMMLTNLSDLRYRILCRDAGADYFFDKSEDFDKVPETIYEIIAGRRTPS
jgi:DNA-binding NarL/FixJ family response regulator